MMKTASLSKAMETALGCVRANPGSTSYHLGLKLSTLNALERRGLVRRKNGNGSFIWPQTSTRWFPASEHSER